MIKARIARIAHFCNDCQEWVIRRGHAYVVRSNSIQNKFKTTKHCSHCWNKANDMREAHVKICSGGQ